MEATANSEKFFFEQGDWRLAFSDQHSTAVSIARHGLIIRRVQLIARLLAVLTVAWLLVDLQTVSWSFMLFIAPARIATAIALALLARHRFMARDTKAAYWAIGTLFAIAVGFFLLANIMFCSFAPENQSLFALTTYLYAPFLIAVGLSLFPLTAIECGVLALPILGSMALAAYLSSSIVGPISISATLWRLALMLCIGSVAAMSQLEFLIELTEKSAGDALTRTWTRRTGEELIRLQFAAAVRKDEPLSLLFIDLDNFKTINDRFGHLAGDDLLRQAAKALKKGVRPQDVIIRWGGEEFLLALPETDSVGAETAIRRLSEVGFGSRPDGGPQTLSIGVAERIGDNARDWKTLIDLADKRMYVAKQSGKNRYVSSNADAARVICTPATRAAEAAGSASPSNIAHDHNTT
jgi:diguanylate cyclase (GGDEF)-like protein